MRWADMDMLGHVNNVTYLDYLQEARIDLFAAHDTFRGRLEGTEGVVVVDFRVDFVSPLVFRRRPVKVDIWVSEIRAGSFTLGYEIYDDTDGRVVHVRATSELAPFVFETERPRRLTPEERAALEALRDPAPTRERLSYPARDGVITPLKVRFSDLDVFGHANNVQYVEFFQESRIQYLMELHEQGEKWSPYVVARTDIEYRRPILLRRKPYDVHNWISHVGNRSFTISAQIRDGDEVLATSHVVMVAFDEKTQASTAMTPEQRRKLLDQLP